MKKVRSRNVFLILFSISHNNKQEQRRNINWSKRQRKRKDLVFSWRIVAVFHLQLVQFSVLYMFLLLSSSPVLILNRKSKRDAEDGERTKKDKRKRRCY